MKRMPVLLRICLGVLLGWLGLSPVAIASDYRSSAIAGAEVYIISPENQAIVRDLAVQNGRYASGLTNELGEEAMKFVAEREQ